MLTAPPHTEDVWPKFFPPYVRMLCHQGTKTFFVETCGDSRALKRLTRWMTGLILSLLCSSCPPEGPLTSEGECTFWTNILTTNRPDGSAFIFRETQSDDPSLRSIADLVFHHSPTEQPNFLPLVANVRRRRSSFYFHARGDEKCPELRLETVKRQTRCSSCLMSP